MIFDIGTKIFVNADIVMVLKKNVKIQLDWIVAAFYYSYGFLRPLLLFSLFILK